MTENDANTPETSPQVNRFFLRHLRENIAKLTREELAEALNISPEKVKYWETGRKPPSLKHQDALELFFGIPSGGLTTDMSDILAADYNTAYFQKADPCERIEWAEKYIFIGQSLRIIPIHPKHEK